MTRLIEISTLVLKVASRCNMDCGYCYIYHGQDTSWKTMPRKMSAEVLGAVVDQVAILYQKQRTKPQVVFHGGEPLLLGVSRLREVVSAFVQRIPDVLLSIQTNGTIFSLPLENLLLEHRANLSFSVSVDGFAPENDRHRIGLRNRSVYDLINGTLKRSSQLGLLDNILMVVDIRNDPLRIYQFMQVTGAKNYNVLLQDGDHDHLPAGKTRANSVEVGEWLWQLFQLYATGKQNFRLKFFDDIAQSLLKKNRAICTPAASYSLCTLTIDTDGEVKQSDTFRVNSDGADRLDGQNIVQSSLYEIANSVTNRTLIGKTDSLSGKCLNCQYLNTCGGGFPPHRAKAGSLENPSIYCNDYLHLFEYMERSLCH